MRNEKVVINTCLTLAVQREFGNLPIANEEVIKTLTPSRKGRKELIPNYYSGSLQLLKTNDSVNKYVEKAKDISMQIAADDGDISSALRKYRI